MWFCLGTSGSGYGWNFYKTSREPRRKRFQIIHKKKEEKKVTFLLPVLEIRRRPAESKSKYSTWPDLHRTTERTRVIKCPPQLRWLSDIIILSVWRPRYVDKSGVSTTDNFHKTTEVYLRRDVTFTQDRGSLDLYTVPLFLCVLEGKTVSLFFVC